MSLAYIGKLALSAILPASVTAVASASASLTAVGPIITSDLAGATLCAGQISGTPPSLAGEIASVGATAVGLAAALTAGTPYVDVQTPQIAALSAELAPIVADLTASLGLTLPLSALFSEAGVEAYSFAGTGAQLGALIPAQLEDGSSPKQALTGFVLASTGGGTWPGLQTFFPTLPGSQPAGSLVSLGGLSVGALVGLLSAALGPANASLQAQLGNLGARYEGALTCAAALSATPPTLPGAIALIGELATNLGGYVSADYITPTAAIAAVSALVAKLTALASSLTSQVSSLASVTSALSTSGVLAFTYAGTMADFGAAVVGAIGAGWPDGTPSTSASNALILLASAPGTGAALQTLFGGL